MLGFLLVKCSDLKQPIPTNLQPKLSVHPAEWLNKNSLVFHGLFIRNIGWNLKNCQQCHGSDYAGGIANSSCLPCHEDTPEDCIVCHGGVDNRTGGPPEDIDGNTMIGTRSVGVHTAHLDGASLTDGVECANCHIVPGSFDASGHVDSDLPAEVMFSNLAVLNDANPIWDTSAESCSNSYCHGNWILSKMESRFQNVYSADEMRGNNSSPQWTDPATAPCGSCHDLPPAGHSPFDLSLCNVCHSTVIDANGNIIDKSKHVNGKVNVFLQEYPMFK